MNAVDSNYIRKVNVELKKNDQLYNTQAVALMLGIESDLPYKKQCRAIISFLRSKKRTNKLIEKILNEVGEENLCCTLVNVLYSLFQPKSMTLRAPIPISEEEYQNLIKRNQKRKLRGKPRKLLEECLFIKYCYCIKKIYYRNLFKKQFFDEDSPSPYALCMSSIYKNRKIKPPYKASYKCRETFDWYK